MEVHTVLFFYFFLLSMLVLSTATDTLTMSQSIRHNGTIISAGKSFELGFFSPSNSTKQYLGIWYKKIPSITAVWVANREMPLFNSSGVLKVTNQGILVLVDGNETTIWSSNSSRSVLNPVAQLLDSGNLVVRDASDDNPENFMWQSFDYPSDTLLPGMKHGRNIITGLDRYLSSWKSSDDPSKGIFTYSLDPRGFPQLIMRAGSDDRFRIGHWNGLRFSGTPDLKQNSFYTFRFVFNQKEMYYITELVNSSVVTRLVLNPEGVVQGFMWIGRTEGWKLYRTAQRDNCDTYALCGAHGTCNIENTPACECLKGFVPKYPKEWNISDWSSGCVRRTPLDCPGGDGFIEYSGIKLPDTRYSWFNASMNLQECKMVCSKNCSCMAYASLDISTKGGSGCLLWFGDLIDIRKFAEIGQEIYIRMASSEIDQVGSDGKKRVKIIVSLVLTAGVLLLGLMMYLGFVWIRL